MMQSPPQYRMMLTLWLTVFQAESWHTFSAASKIVNLMLTCLKLCPTQIKKLEVRIGIFSIISQNKSRSIIMQDKIVKKILVSNFKVASCCCNWKCFGCFLFAKVIKFLIVICTLLLVDSFYCKKFIEKPFCSIICSFSFHSFFILFCVNLWEQQQQISSWQQSGSFFFSLSPFLIRQLMKWPLFSTLPPSIAPLLCV